MQLDDVSHNGRVTYWIFASAMFIRVLTDGASVMQKGSSKVNFRRADTTGQGTLIGAD